MKIRILTFATLLSLALIPLHAALLIDNFDYGSTSGDLIDFGSAGGGWSGGWTDSNKPDYIPGTNLIYNDSNYSNFDNNATTGSSGGGTSIGSRTTRDFESAMSDTVWISALAKMSNVKKNEMLIWVDGKSFFGIRTGDPVARIDGKPDIEGSLPASVSNGHTMLWLARITWDIDASNNDRLEFWINPDLSGGAGGLGPATTSQIRQLGSSISEIGVSSRDNDNYLDALRISDAPNGFELVTAPEPDVLILLGFVFVFCKKGMTIFFSIGSEPCGKKWS